MTGILEFDEGEIFIDGISVKKQPVACKAVTAYIPDNPDLYEFLTGIQYLNFIGDMFGVGKAARGARIEKYAEMFRIAGDLGSLVSAYSHGMKQKLAIIGALLHAPKLMVLDEPFVGTGPGSGVQAQAGVPRDVRRGLGHLLLHARPGRGGENCATRSPSSRAAS